MDWGALVGVLACFYALLLWCGFKIEERKRLNEHVNPKEHR
jgi:hypothetical protein